MAKSKIMRLVRYSASTEEMKDAYKRLVGNPKERGYLGDLGVDERKVLKRIVKKMAVKSFTGIQLAQGKSQ
jgi:hypothetical protein